MKKKFLTSESLGCYSESLNLIHRLSHPIDLRFFCIPLGLMRAENIKNISQPCVSGLVSQPHLMKLGKLLKRIHTMTNLSNIYGVYAKLGKILKNIQFKEPDKVSDSVCEAINALKAALCACSIKDIKDREIKLLMLKKTVLENVTDFYGNVHEDEIEPREREQLTIINQLFAAE